MKKEEFIQKIKNIDLTKNSNWEEWNKIAWKFGHRGYFVQEVDFQYRYKEMKERYGEGYPIELV